MDNNEILLKTLQKENDLIVENYNKLEEKYNQEKQTNEQLLEEKNKILEERNKIKEQLDSILYSRSYKTIEKIKKILGR
jgi:predicted nucleotide-binding protein (sugar kinase/HSP70/actin superfamily)